MAMATATTVTTVTTTTTVTIVTTATEQQWSNEVTKYRSIEVTKLRKILMYFFRFRYFSLDGNGKLSKTLGLWWARSYVDVSLAVSNRSCVKKRSGDCKTTEEHLKNERMSCVTSPKDGRHSSCHDALLGKRTLLIPNKIIIWLKFWTKQVQVQGQQLVALSLKHLQKQLEIRKK